MKLNYTVSCLALALMLPALPVQAQTSDPASTTSPTGCESGMFDAQGACIENAGEGASDDDSDDSTIVPGEDDDEDDGTDADNDGTDDGTDGTDDGADGTDGAADGAGTAQ